MLPWTGAIVVVGLIALLGAGCAMESPPASPWQRWNSLELEASATPLLTGSVKLQLSRESETTVFETESTARLLGATIASSNTRSVILTATGAPLSYIRSSSRRARRYTFLDGGYVVEKLKPPEAPGAPLEQWTVDTRLEYSYPHPAEGRPVTVYDYYSMLLRLRDEAIREPGDETTLWVATSRGPKAFRILVAESRTSERTFRDLGSGLESSLPLEELRLRIIPADPESADEGFLKMEGETELWVESESKTLIHIGGKSPSIPARIELVLAAMG